ncbi:MAG: PKD domain-containing protein, partial [Thermoplasmata archaeon]
LISVIGVLLLMSTPKPQENKPPVANFTMDKTSAKVNEPVTFTSTSYDPDGNETIVKHLWEFGDNTNKTGNLRTVTHSYGAPGVYTVKLTVEDEKGAQNSITRTLSITEEIYDEYQNVTVNELLTNPQNYLEKKVRLNGCIVADMGYYPGNLTNSTTFYVVDDAGIKGLNIYTQPNATRPATINYNEKLVIKGTFTTYKEAFELKVSAGTPDSVESLGTYGKNSYENYTVSSLLANAGNANYSFVKIDNAVVDWVNKSYKYTITDVGGGANITVYCEFGANAPYVSSGDNISVQGWFKYYSKEGVWEITVRNGTEDKVELKGVAYTRVTVNELLTNPGSYLNKSVELTDVVYAYRVHWNASNLSEYASFYVIDNGGTKGLNVFATSNATRPAVVAYGDLLHIKGKFEIYNNAYEVYVGKSTTPDLIDKTGSGGTNIYASYPDINTLLGSTTTANNSFVKLNNLVVDYVYASYKFTVRDNSTSTNITIYGEYGANIPAVSAGQIVNVSGWFTWYTSGGYWEIVIRNASSDIVEVSGQSQQYIPVTVNELLTNPGSYLNKSVELTDVVYAYRVHWNASNLSEYASFYVIDNGGTKGLNVFATSNATRPAVVAYGDLLHIKGKFEIYNNAYEVYVGKSTTPDLIDKTGSGGTNIYASYPDINTLLGSTTTANNSFVKLNNLVVDYVYASYKFTVRDNSTSTNITIYGEYGANIPAVSAGQIVNVSGWFTWYTSGGYWEIVIRNASSDAVEVNTQSPYTQVTVATLLANPSQYNNTEVCLKNVYVDWAKTTYNFNVKDAPSDTSNLTIYVSKNAKAQPIYTGYYVDIYGEFTWYTSGGYWEIYIRNYTDDKVIAIYNYQRITVSELLANSSTYLGKNVSIDYAIITNITYNYYLFRVKDNSTTQELTIYVNKNATSPSALSVGQAVKVSGVFKLYNTTYEIQIRNYSTDAVALLSANTGLDNSHANTGGIGWKENRMERNSHIVRIARDL